MKYNIIVSPYQQNIVDTKYSFKQNDYGATLSITVEDYDTTGTTAKIVFRRNDGVIREYNIARSSDGTYNYNLSADEIYSPGKVVVDLKFYKSNVRESTASFIFYVTTDKTGATFESGDYSDSISNAIERCDQAIANIQAQANQAMQDVENALLAELNIYDGTDKTTAGYAADARQINENVPGSFAESLKNRIGLLSNLTTTTKSSIVSALNEVNNNLTAKQITSFTFSNKLTNTNGFCYQIGKMCFVTLNVTTNTILANADDTILSGLPVPAKEWYVSLYCQGLRSSRFVLFTDGSLKTFWDNDIPANTVIHDCFSYPIA